MLLREGSPVDLLLENCFESDQGVRLNCLKVLADASPEEHERIREKIRELSHKVTTIEEALIIYQILGLEAEGAMRKLVAEEDLTGLEQTVADIAAGMAEQGQRGLLEDLANHSGQMGKLCLEHLARIGDIEAGSRIMEVFNDASDRSRQVAAVQAMSLLGHRADCRFLLEQLLEAHVEVRIAAARTLGECGDVSVVEPMALERDKARGALRQALDEGISQIQSGLGDVEAGWLTVRQTNESEGALSLQENIAPEGMLSLTDEEPEEITKGS